MNAPFDLSGRVALVTGAAQGIGRAIAEVLAESGASVVINDLKADGRSHEFVQSLSKSGYTAWNMPADVSSEAAVQSLFERISSECGRLDILVNNAGTSVNADIYETELDEWNRILQVNLTSAFLCSKQAMKLMRTQKYGRIVNISSVVAQQGALMGPVHYAASKSGLIGMTKTLARTGAPLGIHVNAVAPGIIETELLQQSHGASGVQEIAAKVPLGLGKPRDVGNAVGFLCSPAANYITGATLDVNGGMYLR